MKRVAPAVIWCLLMVFGLAGMSSAYTVDLAEGTEYVIRINDLDVTGLLVEYDLSTEYNATYDVTFVQYIISDWTSANGFDFDWGGYDVIVWNTWQAAYALSAAMSGHAWVDYDGNIETGTTPQDDGMPPYGYKEIWIPWDAGGGIQCAGIQQSGSETAWVSFNNQLIDADTYSRTIAVFTEVSQVPIPGAVWLLGSGLIGLVGIRKKFKK